jgi:hypothetical protein
MIVKTDELTGKVSGIYKGPQFETKGGVILFFIAALVLFLSGSFFSKGETLYAFISMLSCAILAFLVLDIHGIEIDYENERIKDYRNILGLRAGKWEDLRSYGVVRVSIKRMEMPTSEGSDHSFDSYFYYYVKLLNKYDNKEIFLAEFDDKEKAFQFAAKIADSLRIRVEKG